MTNKALAQPIITCLLVSEVQTLAASRFSDEVVEVARQLVLDWFGNVISGGSEPLVNEIRSSSVAAPELPRLTLPR